MDDIHYISSFHCNKNFIIRKLCKNQTIFERISIKTLQTIKKVSIIIIIIICFYGISYANVEVN